MLKIDGIKKTYSNGKGLKSLSLKAKRGEIVCLIGPNGSGKSTALRVIAGIIKCDNGTCRLNNTETFDREIKRDIGYLEESPFYYDNISVENFLTFIWGVKYSNEPNDELQRLLKKFDLSSIRNYKMKELSMGLKKRVGIISSIMNYPNLIILDEPANGLDTKSIINLKDEIKRASERSIIIISSHILEYLKSLGTRIVFLKEGLAIKELNIDYSVNLEALYRSIYMT
ncbi:MAG: ABC transporter ATP-binding protein [Clostridiales bacterium]|nr:ABC transporter ATP-binding protein [Clostridiales bacterium]